MLSKLIDKGKQCGFQLKDGCCGGPALVSVGGTLLCREHFEYAVDLMPMEFMVGYPAVPPVAKVKLKPVTKTEFLHALAEWDAHK